MNDKIELGYMYGSLYSAIKAISRNNNERVAIDVIRPLFEAVYTGVGLHQYLVLSEPVKGNNHNLWYSNGFVISCFDNYSENSVQINRARLEMSLIEEKITPVYMLNRKEIL